jgi:uncharacterized protein YjbI with pentapeptide repeats
MAVTEIAGEPRSLAEMDFVAGLRPCEACGDWRLVAWRTSATGDTWTVHAACPRCATERAYAFHSSADLAAIEAPPLELGGPAPSALVEPFELVREIDRLVPLVAANPVQLAGDAWAANEAVVDRIRTALAELAKFLAGDAVPSAAHRSADARGDARARPERYTRAWVTTERAHWAAIAARIAADGSRILAAERLVSPRGRFDGDALVAHRGWLETDGRHGRRLDVVTADARAVNVRGARLADARLERVQLRDADLVGTELDRAELVGVELAGARAETATFTGAQLRDCDLTGARAENAGFEGARLRNCTLDRAELAWSRWERATLSRTSLRGAVLDEAELALARLSECDLRGATLYGATLAGAVLERCDLRGAALAGCDLRGTTLIACAVDGARGVPASVAGWSVVDADFSPAADGSDLGDADDVLAELVAS